MKKLTLCKLVLTVILFCFLSSVFCLPAYAGIPHFINYQGRLTYTNGVPLDGNYTVIFRIYDSATTGTGTPLWQGTYPVSIQKGLFSVLLGEINDAVYNNFTNLAFDKPYYLQIVVNGEVMKDSQGQDRQLITSSGYAIRAEKAEKADNATQAQNADTVANVGVSATPQPNKILPLDSNAKLPSSILSSLPFKVYDSGWFAVTQNTTYTKTHNLGTTKCLVTVMVAQNSDGSGWCFVVGSHTPAGYNTNSHVCKIDATIIGVRTGRDLANGFDEYGNYITDVFNGYCRILMLALE